MASPTSSAVFAFAKSKDRDFAFISSIPICLRLLSIDCGFFSLAKIYNTDDLIFPFGVVVGIFPEADSSG